LSAEPWICERSPVKDSFQQALDQTLSILTRIKDGFGPHPTVSSEFLERLKTASTREPLEAADEGSDDPKSKRVFAGLREATLACVRCPHLARSRTQVVFGVGNPHAELMFVGEAPGADEDAQGEPFVGRAGQLLTKIIEAMGFRREDVYIANVLKCRPDMPPGVSGNRKPTPDEMKTCLPWLEKQIELIKPRVMVALGATALEGLLGATTAVSKVRGRWLDFHGIPIMATYHPAYLLQVLERLGKPISERQQRFFTKTES
jgi:uracil-DNA glycosylase